MSRSIRVVTLMKHNGQQLKVTMTVMANIRVV
jgi:hypothetical protein